jgi:hypothetical protein
MTAEHLIVNGDTTFVGDVLFMETSSEYDSSIVTNLYVGEKITIGNDSPQNSLTVFAADGVMDNKYVAYLYNAESTAGRSQGLRVRAGTNSSDNIFDGQNVDGSSQFWITGDGKVHANGNIVTDASIGIGTTNPIASIHTMGDIIVAGKVGIGSTNPQGQFEVIVPYQSGTVFAGLFKSDASTGFTNGVKILAGSSASDGGEVLHIANYNDTTGYMAIDAAAGYILLGDTNATNTAVSIQSDATCEKGLRAIGTAFIGNIDYQYGTNLTFKKDTTTNMVLKGTGLLGIGTTNPDRQLHLYYNPSSGSDPMIHLESPYSSLMTMDWTGLGGRAKFGFTPSSNLMRLYMDGGTGSLKDIISFTYNGTSIQTDMTGNVVVNGQATFSELVGIGTSNPATNLHIFHDTISPSIKIQAGASIPFISVVSLDMTGVGGESTLSFYPATNLLKFWMDGGTGIPSEIIKLNGVSGEVEIDNNLVVDKKIGIGTTPTYDLDILGSSTVHGRIESTGGAAQFILDGTSSSSAGYIVNLNGANQGVFGANTLTGVYVSAASNKSVYLMTNNTAHTIEMDTTGNLLIPLNGNLGIGSTTPQNSLDVVNSGGKYAASFVSSEVTTNAAMGLSVMLYPGSYDASALFIGTSSDTYLSIHNKTGNVGIGIDASTSSTHLLAMKSGGYYDSGTGNWVDVSSRVFKQDIVSPYSDPVLSILDSIEVVNYRYKAEVKNSEAARVHIGIIAEDAPELLVTQDKDGLSTPDCIGFLLAVVKELKKKVEDLEAQLRSK